VEELRPQLVLLTEPINTIGEQQVDDLVASVKHVLLGD
jgi:hypothetical protein